MIRLNHDVFVALVPLGKVSQSLEKKEPGNTFPEPKQIVIASFKNKNSKLTWIIISNDGTCLRFYKNLAQKSR